MSNLPEALTAVAVNLEAYTTRAAHELSAPEHWAKLAFVSDLHLDTLGSAAGLATLQAWLDFAASPPDFDALFLLGDFWEVWVGDDTDTHTSVLVEQSLRVLSCQIPVYMMHGNRDFLMGPRFCERTGLKLLPDPTVLTFKGQRTLLSHGDALCTEDVAYMQFRHMVRNTDWQAQFLARPMAERMQIAQHIRSESMQKQATNSQETQDTRSTAAPISSTSTPWADVNLKAVQKTLALNHCTRMVHGHTHQGRSFWVGENTYFSDTNAESFNHTTDVTLPQRHVLSDWHIEGTKHKVSADRAEVLYLTASGVQRQSLVA